MRLFTFAVLLLGACFLTMKADDCSAVRNKKPIHLGGWKDKQRTPDLIPIEATLEGSTIQILFIEKRSRSVTLQVRDENGGVVYQDVVSPAGQDIYFIELEGLEGGRYELRYMEGEKMMVGEFEMK